MQFVLRLIIDYAQSNGAHVKGKKVEILHYIVFFYCEKTSTFALSLSHLAREYSPKNRKYELTTGGSLESCLGDSNMTNSRKTICLRN